MGTTLPWSFFARDAVTVARSLIGAILLVDRIGGLIVELSGPTPWNTAMVGPAGHAYMGRPYEMYWFVNFV